VSEPESTRSSPFYRRLRLKYTSEQVIDVVEYAKAQEMGSHSAAPCAAFRPRQPEKDASTMKTKAKRAGLEAGKTFDACSAYVLNAKIDPGEPESASVDDPWRESGDRWTIRYRQEPLA